MCSVQCVFVPVKKTRSTKEAKKKQFIVSSAGSQKLLLREKQKEIINYLS